MIVEVGEFYIFEIKDRKMKQISGVLDTIEEANEFMKTMKEGLYYKSIKPESVLVALQVKSLS